MSQITKPSQIAVIGLACWYPGAQNPIQLWENILARRRQFRHIPDCRTNASDYHHPDPENPDTSYSSIAAVIDGFEFDWQRRRIPFSTFQSTDIAHWLALEVAFEAIADAGYTRDTIPHDTTGVIIGNTLTGEQTRANTMRLRWPYVRRVFQTVAKAEGLPQRVAQNIESRIEYFYKSAFPVVNEDSLAGGLSNTIAGRICNYLDLYGGGYTVDGACSSSLLAIATAASALSSRTLDLALAGGVDISLDPFELVGFSKTGALAQDEMRVYDRRGNGFLPGEGCGLVVLKRLEDARRDQNYVYAVIHGWGISSDGGGSGITAPNVKGQSRAIKRAYAQAPYKLQDVHFIEGHGTGTTVGDRVELEALSRVMRDVSKFGNTLSCGMTSLKSIIGHAKAASGVGGFIKAVMAVNRRILPPMAGCEEPHPAFATYGGCLFPILKGKICKPVDTLRAGVSAMGFGGINCHITIESGDAPSHRLEPKPNERRLLVSGQKTELFVLTADSLSALKEKVKALIVTVRGISFAELTDLAAHLANQTEPEDAFRAACVAEKPKKLEAGLDRLLGMIQNRSLIEGEILYAPENRLWLGRRKDQIRVAMLFPGQGSQQINMARTLVERFAWAQELVNEANLWLEDMLPDSISNYIYHAVDSSGTDDENAWLKALLRTDVAQPSICLASVVWYRFLKKLGITPIAVGGHSLGELTAFHAAGAFDTTTLLRFAAIRGKAMAATGQNAGSMVSLQCTRERVEALLKLVSGYAELANFNGPKQTVVSGEKSAIEQVVKIATQWGIQSHKLNVSNAFHSRMVSGAAQRIQLEACLPGVLEKPSFRLFSGVNGAEVESRVDLVDHFANQITSPVDFVSMIDSMAGVCDIFIEVGPGSVLSGLVHSITGDKGPICMPVESQSSRDEDLNALLSRLFVQGANINWQVLYEGRLVRSFIPPSERIFIENPCERPFDIPESSDTRGSSLPEDIFTPLLSDLTAFSPADLKAYFKARGPFISQVIQADLKHASLNGPHPGERRPETNLMQPEIVSSKSPGLYPSTNTGSHKDMQALLLSLVEKATGFAQESLQLNMRLLDDLNLDSIKAGDLVVKAMTTSGFEGHIEPLDYSNATLQDILDRVMPSNRKPLPGRTAPERMDIMVVLREKAARVLKISEDSIDPDALLGSDLGVGLVMLKDLLRSIASDLKIDLTVDPLPILNRNLRQLSIILERLIPKGPEDPVWDKVDLNPCVREFANELTPMDLPVPPDSWGNRMEDNWQAANVLILSGSDNIQVGEALQNELARYGARVTSASFEEAKNHSLAKDISYSHFVAVLPQKPASYKSNKAYLQFIVEYLASLTMSPAASQAPRRRTTVAYIQFGGGYFGSRPKLTDLNPCCATALGKSIHLERKDLRVRVLDFFPFSNPQKIALKVIEEIHTPDSFSAVGFDNRFTRRISRQRLLQPVFYRPRELTWSSEDVILVTGGAKGITASCALALAKASGARMALVGLSPHPDSTPGDTGNQVIAENLAKFTQENVEAKYYSCDVTDLEAVASLIKLVQKEMGPVTGVIHGAGLNNPNRTNRVSVDQAIQEVSPKIMGALNLLYLLEDTPPKIFIGLSSIIGITGMPGNAWYGFSNESLDIILRRFRSEHPATQVLSVAFSLWRDEGMGARMGAVKSLRRLGVHGIPTEEGVKRFVRLFFNDPGVHQIIVSGRLGGLDTWHIEPIPDDLNARYLEQPILITPGVESVYRAHLNFEKDPYLKDHCFNGSYLFPTVFGLEAMAQVVSHVTGIRDFSRVRIDDIRLDRPITVDADGAEIILWAQVEELESKASNQVVRAGIIKLHAGIKENFFSATFVLGLTDKAPGHVVDLPHSPLNIIPETDLYRDQLLFQGPRFQRIQKVWKLSKQNDGHISTIFSAGLESLEGLTTVFQDNLPCTLLLGDPYCRDTLLQSVQLLVPQEECLPVRISRLEIYPFENKSDSILVGAQLEHIADKEIQSTVLVFDSNGSVKEKLEKYTVNIIKHLQDNPSIADLVLPEARDNRMVNRTLQEIGELIQLKVPHVELSYIPGIHNLPKEDRRKLETRALKKAVHQVLEFETDSFQNLRIEWLDTGRPVVNGLLENDLQVSVAHDDRLCVCSAGYGKHGCDIAPVGRRTREEWVLLLGREGAKLLEMLLISNDSLNLEGTRVWAAKEALFKNTGGKSDLTEILRNDNGFTLFQGTSKEGSVLVLTKALNLTWGPERILALTIPQTTKRKPPQKPLKRDYKGYTDLTEKRQYEIVESGPQGQAIFIHRLALGFRPNAQLSRTVYFSNYFFWAGEIREASIWPILGKVGRLFSSGQNGTVTNNTHISILGDATAQDQIEIRLWASGNGGPANSTMQLTYDFRKILPNGYERLAWCKQEVTWVRILDHGLVKPEPYPDYYWHLMKDMLPLDNASNTLEVLPEPLAQLRSAEGDLEQYKASPGPVIRPTLYTQKIETSLEDSNLVGNIYFAHYYKWMGKTRDRYFFELIPEHFRGNGEQGELVCLECHVTHLREAMPFDIIEVTMALKKLNTYSAQFYFEYFRLDGEGNNVKLAFGDHLAIWVKRDAMGNAVPSPFPVQVKLSFQKAILEYN